MAAAILKRSQRAGMRLNAANLPSFRQLQHFEKLIILDLLSLASNLVFSSLSTFSLKGVHYNILALMFKLPPARKLVYSQVHMAQTTVVKQQSNTTALGLWHRSKTCIQISLSQIFRLVGEGVTRGKDSGSRDLNQAHCKFVSNLSKYFSNQSTSGGNFLFVMQMEIEVVGLKLQDLCKTVRRIAGLMSNEDLRKVIESFQVSK